MILKSFLPSPNFVHHHFLARSGYRPQCFLSAALEGVSDFKLIFLGKDGQTHLQATVVRGTALQHFQAQQFPQRTSFFLSSHWGITAV
eukprot:461213-Pelagomonas_calceolata.AAC.2